MSIVIGGATLGHISALSPDYEKAKMAAARLFKIFDRKSLIDSSSQVGLTPVRNFSANFMTTDGPFLLIVVPHVVWSCVTLISMPFLVLFT